MSAGRFSAIFARVCDPARQEALRVALSRWPGSTARLIDTPFTGFALILPPDASPDAARTFEASLPAFSRAHPEATLVALSAEEDGGPLLYEGLACHAGRTVLRCEVPQCEQDSLNNLTLLLRQLESE